ncbi:hypothetical protein L915_08691 [Phytophthora nicotianae]|uniref:Integrase catalytic domain-containing protein n=1 Tax=Phytophthora nicotianae TaxID=4792 RepID=W2GUP2_PHYNI|nr:hypothetical protein L915_08691 [Phytophthora nicotianae]
MSLLQKFGNVIEQRFKLKNKEEYAQQDRNEQSAANFNSSSPSTTAVADRSSPTRSDDEVEVVDEEEISTSTVSPMHRENEIIRKQGTCDGKPVVIMFDSGATGNVVRPGLVANTTASGVSQLTRLDGTSTKRRSVKKGQATIEFGRYRFRKLQVMEWTLGSAHDVILGKPWFTKFQRCIDLRSHEITFPSVSRAPPSPIATEAAVEIAAADFKRNVKKQVYDEMYRVKNCAVMPLSDSTPVPITQLLKEFTDKDPTSGHQLSRSELVRSGNSTLPIRWVIDYRYVNSKSIIPKIPLPRIDELFDQMSGCVIFSVLDLAQGYHQMRIALESRKYIGFRTHAETYQWCVAPMGLPGVWSRLMRTEVIAKWTTPVNQKQLHRFLGLAGYYRRFIRDYAILALPLGPLIKIEHVWNWGSEQTRSFEEIKFALQEAPVLKLSDYEKRFIATTDASGYCVGGVISRVRSGQDHPVAFVLKKLGPHEINWPTHENELFAIKLALKKWRHYLEFAAGYRNCPDYGDRLKHPEQPFVMQNGLRFRKSQTTMRLCVPYTRDNHLRTSIISCFQDSNIAAHPGVHRTYLRIAQWYHWPTLDQDVRDYVESCETCTRWKHSNTRKNGKMIPIPIPEECWSVLSMDFITGLPDSNDFDAILTVVDKLSKRPKYRACNRTDDAQKTAYHFFDCVVRYHGLPSIIISDRDSNASTGMSPFEVDTGRKERNTLNPVNNTSTMAQERQKKYYDKKRSSITFKEGDLVMLDIRRIPSAHVTQDIDGKRAKLAARKVGPFEIVKMISPNVAKLNLPRSMSRLNSTFNVDVLSHYIDNPSRFKTRPIPKASRLIIDDDTGDTMHIIEKLL